MTTRVTTKRPAGSEPRDVRFDRYTSKPMAMARYLAQRVLLGGVIRSILTVRILGR